MGLLYVYGVEFYVLCPDCSFCDELELEERFIVAEHFTKCKVFVNRWLSAEEGKGEAAQRRTARYVLLNSLPCCTRGPITMQS